MIEFLNPDADVGIENTPYDLSVKVEGDGKLSPNYLKYIAEGGHWCSVSVHTSMSRTRHNGWRVPKALNYEQ